MKNILIMKILSVYLFYFLMNLFYCQKLRFVFNVFRHGARAPYYLDNSNVDLFGNSWENESKLTQVGIRQHYLNGIKIRQKYFQLLNISEFNYNSNEIAVYSTDTERTIMSAYSFLFGMFPPGTGKEFENYNMFIEKISQPPIKNFNYSQIEKNLNSSVIASKINLFPVRLFDKKANYFDLNDPKICPPVKAYQDENEKAPEFQDFLINFRKIYGDRILKIMNKTASPEFLNNGWNIYKIFDAFESNFFEGKDLKKFTNEGIDLSEFKNLTDQFLYVSDFVYNYGDKDSWIARFSFSPIFEYLIEIMDARIILDKTGLDIYNSQNPKMLFYSGHDTNLGAMQMFLKYSFGDKINLHNNYFASVFSFEIYQNATYQKSNNKFKNKENILDEEYFLKVYFNDFDYFGGPINYSYFKNVIKRNIIPREKIYTFCQFKPDYQPEKKLILIASICILSLLIIGLLYLIFKYNKGQVNNKDIHTKNNYERI